MGNLLNTHMQTIAVKEQQLNNWACDAFMKNNPVVNSNVSSKFCNLESIETVVKVKMP